MSSEFSDQIANQQLSPGSFPPNNTGLMTGIMLFQWVALLTFTPVKIMVWLDIATESVERLDLITSLLLGLAVAANIAIYKGLKKSQIFIRINDLTAIHDDLKIHGFEPKNDSKSKRVYKFRINPILRFKAVVKSGPQHTTLTYPAQLDGVFKKYQLY